MLELDPRMLFVQTLKPYVTGAADGLPDVLVRYRLESGDRDATAIEERLAEVRGIWNRSLRHPRYGAICEALVAEHDDAALTILDRARGGDSALADLPVVVASVAAVVPHEDPQEPTGSAEPDVLPPLDPRTYLADTLRPYATAARSGVPDFFERYLLSPTVVDDQLIAERVDAVYNIWRRSFEHPRYGMLAMRLAQEHDEACLSLLDPREHARLADEHRARSNATASAAAKALAEWHELLEIFGASHGGLTPAGRAILERCAQRLGLEARSTHEVLDAAPVAAAPGIMPHEVFHAIVRSLDALVDETGDERRGLSLCHAIGMPAVTDDVVAVQDHYAASEAENRGRPFGQSSTVHRTVLANVRLYMLDGDPRVYIERLVVEVTDALEPEAALAALPEELDADSADRLLARALGLGLSTQLARRVVVDLARRLDVTLIVSREFPARQSSPGPLPHVSFHA